jgi:predicted negative regulator of RcsB-dependent stress response
VEIYNPDDQLATLKAWWKQYGTSLIAGVAIGVTVLVGLNYWKHHRELRAQNASALYDQLLAQTTQGKSETALAVATQLIDDYAGTVYAGKAALLAAKLRYDAQDTAGARERLEWAAKNAREPAVQHSARLRLGRLMLEQGEADATLNLIQVKDMDGFDSEYEELRGDALLAKNDRDGARRAYRAALEKLPRGSAYGPLLSLKLDNLGPEPKS